MSQNMFTRLRITAIGHNTVFLKMIRGRVELRKLGGATRIPVLDLSGEIVLKSYLFTLVDT